VALFYISGGEMKNDLFILNGEGYLSRSHYDEYCAYIYQKYKFVGSESETIDFIREYNLLPILLQAPREIQRVFGDDVVLELDLHADAGGCRELFIVIKTHYSPEEAMRLEKKLFNEWFIGIMDKADNKLSFTEEPL
jgi:hypothetical protein